MYSQKRKQRLLLKQVSVSVFLFNNVMSVSFTPIITAPLRLSLSKRQHLVLLYNEKNILTAYRRENTAPRYPHDSFLNNDKTLNSDESDGIIYSACLFIADKFTQM